MFRFIRRGIFLVSFFLVSGAFAGTLPTPSDLRIDSVNSSACQTQLRWDWEGEGNSKTIFKIWRDGGLRGSAPSLGDFMYLDNSVKPGIEYPYKVNALNSSAGGAESLYTDILTRFAPSILIPSVPLRFTAKWVVPAEDEAFSQHILTWDGTEPNEYGGYEVWQSDDGGALWKLADRISLKSLVSAKEYLSLPVADNTKLYVYKIRAFNSDRFCDVSLADEVAYSEFTSPLFLAPIPVAPSSLSASIEEVLPDQVSVRVSWKHRADFDGMFEVYAGDLPDAVGGGGIKMTGDASIFSRSEDMFSHVFSLKPHTTYAFKVQALRTRDGETLRSEFSKVVSIETGLGKPSNVKSTIAGFLGEKARVSLQWTDNSLYEEGFEVVRGEDFSGLFVSVCSVGANAQACVDSDVPPGGTYYYKVRAKKDAGFSDFSDTSSVDTDVSPIRGWAWANAGSLEGNALGVGWISLSSDNDTDSSHPYGVFVSNKPGGRLSGYAWSGIRCPPSRSGSCGYGWLSFNTSDLSGCPLGSCTASLDKASGRLSGWAKFLAADPKNGIWTGWVSLRTQGGADDKAYGVCFGSSTTPTGETCVGNGDKKFESMDMLSGFAWGSDVGGWIQFTGGGDSSDDGTTDGCLVSSVSIFPSGAYLKFGESASFAVSILGVAGCLPENRVVTWEIVEGAEYGTIDASGKYIAPLALPSGKTLPLSVTIRARSVSNPDIFGTALAQVSDVSLLVRAQCNLSTPSTPKIEVGWNGAPSLSHKIEILRSTPKDDSFGVIRTLDSLLKSSGTFVDSPVVLRTPYYYRVKATYKNADDVAQTRESNSAMARCENLNKEPSNVQVFAHDDSALYVNWKDNDSREGHTFTIERIRVTPKTPEPVLPPPSSLSTQKGVVSITDSSVELIWKNATTWIPYNHKIEQSTQAGATDRFKASGDITLKVFGPDDFLMRNPSSEPSVSVKEFRYAVGSLEEATTYYFRLSSCSQIPLTELGGVTKYRGKVISGNRSGRPDPACSALPSASFGSFPPNVISTTTLLKTPLDFTATAISSSRIRLSWNDQSRKEEGFEIYRDGALVKTLSTSDMAGTPAVSYEDDGLVPHTRHTYLVRAYKVFGSGQIYSKFTEERSATTHFVVRTSTSGSGSGSITSSPAGGSCGVSCSEFPDGTSVAFSASASAGSRFDGWSGDCSGTLSCSASGNKTIVASFSPSLKMVTVTIGGEGTGSVSGGGLMCSKDTVLEKICSVAMEPGEKTLTLSLTGGSVVEAGAWDGCSSGTFTSCTFTLSDIAKSISVSIDPPVGGAIPKREQFASVFGASSLLSEFGERALAEVFQLGAFVRAFATPLFETPNVRNMEIARVGRTQCLGCPTSSGMADIPRPTPFIPYAGLSEIVSGLKERARAIFTGFVSPSLAGSSVVYEEYFVEAKSGLSVAAYEDRGPDRVSGAPELDLDTVYLYRVKSCVGMDCSDWSEETVGKTLREIKTSELNPRPICTRNSFCNYKITKNVSLPDEKGVLEESEQQCRVNADCANVGRFDQSFEER